MSESKIHYMAAAVADALAEERHNLGFRQMAYEKIIDLLEQAGVNVTEPAEWRHIKDPDRQARAYEDWLRS